MGIVAIVQARMTSSRLPGKVLMDLDGVPLLAHTFRRLQWAQTIDEVVLATSDGLADDSLAALAAAEGVRCHRGSETDVLSRYNDAASRVDAEVVLRVTGDCPLVDPEVVDTVVRTLLTDPSGADYASNVLRRTYPQGLDCEALWRDTLERLARLGTSPAAREHVTWFAYRERPELFLLRSVELDEDHSAVNWSVDTRADLERVRQLPEPWVEGRPRPWREFLAQRRQEPGAEVRDDHVSDRASSRTTPQRG